MLPIFTTGQVKDGIDTGDLMLDLSDYMKKKDGVTKIELNNLSAVVSNKLDATPQHNHHIEDIKQLQSLLDAKYDKGEKYPYNTIISNIEKIPYLESPKVAQLDIVSDENTTGYTFYVDESSGDLMIILNDVLIGTYSKSGNKWILNGIEQGIKVDHKHEEYETKITAIENNLETIQSSTNSVLENHAEALNAVCNATLTNITDINTNSVKINTLESTINELRSKSDEFVEYIVKTDAIIKNHYDALLLLCQKHGMIDSNENDEENITPENE